jgi:predicted ribosomally synthesized peptide with nif11-like leader
MSAQLTAFLDAAKVDTALQEKLMAAGNPDAAVAIAQEAGFTFSSEDLLEASEADDLELETWQLEAISGGKGSAAPAPAPPSGGHSSSNSSVYDTNAATLRRRAKDGL